MKCVICHGENIKVMDIKEEVVVGNDVAEKKGLDLHNSVAKYEKQIRY